MKVIKAGCIMLISMAAMAVIAQQLKQQTLQGKIRVDSLRKLVTNEKDPKKKEVIGVQIINTLNPDDKEDQLLKDNINLSIATSFANAKNPAKAVTYAKQLKQISWIGEGKSRVALILLHNGNLKEARVLLKMATEAMLPFANADIKTDYQRFSAYLGYKYYCRDLADVLYRLGKYAEALEYIRISHGAFKETVGSVNSIYVQALVKMNNYSEAFEIIDEAIRHGQSTPVIKSLIKPIYVKAKGTEVGYAAYDSLVKAQFAAQVKATIAKQIIKQKAPSFSLRDLNGNLVSTDSLKGKTIVLDFWATWCVPCKASFPAMQKAVNRYKNDPNVKFYFIHTMEYGAKEKVIEEVKAYMKDTKYPFEVLMDLKDEDTKKNVVVDSYNTSMIPAKFVIDKNGDLRFRLVGYHEGDDATLEQVTAMIELVK